jgi:hypothetical protein
MKYLILILSIYTFSQVTQCKTNEQIIAKMEDVPNVGKKLSLTIKEDIPKISINNTMTLEGIPIINNMHLFFTFPITFSPPIKKGDYEVEISVNKPELLQDTPGSNMKVKGEFRVKDINNTDFACVNYDISKKESQKEEPFRLLSETKTKIKNVQDTKTNSINNCGTKSDIVADAKMTMDYTNNAITINIEGTLSEDVTEGNINFDLKKYKILPTGNTERKMSMHFKFTKGALLKGAFKVTVGPFYMPNLPIEYFIEQLDISMTDKMNKEILCNSLSLKPSEINECSKLDKSQS